ncbi:MAG: S8 family peptidase [Acidimicrobiia bacterium]|nr:S8 family peptidase [Acidimicrobiia bacterium]
MAEEKGQAQDQPRLISYIISPQVQKAIEENPAEPQDVIISLIEDPHLGVKPAQTALQEWIVSQLDVVVRPSEFYLFARLTPDQIRAVAMRGEVYQIWLDSDCQVHLLSSADTIKAPASWRTFEARGKGITWAVMDTGIRYDHPHLANNINKTLSKNFSNSPDEEDVNGHGTHVAGIIAGQAPAGSQPSAATLLGDDTNVKITPLDALPSGVAPLATLVNVKVLDDNGSGKASRAILGLEYLRQLNQATSGITIDGVNMSLGYPFDPKYYGCGYSPLCEEVRRAVNSGLVVVISCGNEGYGMVRLKTGQEVPLYLQLSIADPANTEEAIAVGSTHKTKPHNYGISFFSSKGPTGDGRIKPDLVAPGEKILSCSLHFNSPNGQQYDYEERSGTSMAAPHVSGAIAAFLSVNKEFRADPRRVKEIFKKTATDLGRERSFQGAGLVDTLRALMSV